MSTQVLSADSHVLEPPDLWTTRMQAKFRDRAPHVSRSTTARRATSSSVSRCVPSTRSASVAPVSTPEAGAPGRGLRRLPPRQLGPGRAPQGHGHGRPRRRDLLLRLRHVDVQLPGDDEFQRDAHRAYNDWAAEYASYAPKRLIPIANISMTDPEIDLAALTKAKKTGFRGIFISNDPLDDRRYDNPMWDKFWRLSRSTTCPSTCTSSPVRAARRSAPTRWSMACAADPGLPHHRRDGHRRRVRQAPQPEDGQGRERHRLDPQLPQAHGVVRLPLRPALPPLRRTRRHLGTPGLPHLPGRRPGMRCAT